MRDFDAKLTAIENGAAAKPPWPPEQISVKLGDVATLAGNDFMLNCRVADVIKTYHVPLPNVITVELQDSQNGSASWLRCYRVAVANAEQQATRNMTGSPKAETASSTQASAILKAVTTANTRGWMYLGHLQAGSLDQTRTILQDRVNVGGSVTTGKDVYLHEQGRAGSRSDAKVIGVVPAGSRVSILNLSLPSEPYVWAEVAVSTNASATTHQPLATPVTTPTVTTPTVTTPTMPTLPRASIQVRTIEWNGSSGPLSISDLSVRLNIANLRVVDIIGLAMEGSGPRKYTLNEAEVATKAILLVPAGAAKATSTPAPIGLVRINGVTVTPLGTSTFATGIFCISKAGIPSIIKVGDPAVVACKDAVQSGPIIINPDGSQNIPKTELQNQALVHTIVVLNKNGEAHFLTTSAPAHLYDLQNFAVQTLGGTAALNLSANSGLILNERNQHLNLGSIDKPEPTAIGVFQSDRQP